VRGVSFWNALRELCTHLSSFTDRGDLARSPG
jgi:hypothetical protein